VVKNERYLNMLNKRNINLNKRIVIVYIVLALAILAVFWQVHQFDFVNLDDDRYVTQNAYVQSGITLNGLCWAFQHNLCPILASLDMAILDARLSTLRFECRRLSCNQPYHTYSEHVTALLAL